MPAKVTNRAKPKSGAKADLELLLELMNLFGVSGSEKSVRDFIIKKIRPHVDSIKVDRLGNLVATQKGRKPKIMLAAHMDEIGLMVKSIDHTGSLFLSEIGSMASKTLLGQRVLVQSGKGLLPGVISTKAISNWVESDNSDSELKNMFVDTGLDLAAVKRAGVTVGSTVSLVQDNVFLAGGRLVCGKALDDRVGCFVLIELARRLRKTPEEIDFVFTVQEEVGLYGSRTSAFSVDPDIGIAVDVTNSNDVLEDRPTKILGNGPVLIVKDSDMIASKSINDALIAIAKRRKASLQLAVMSGGTTDALSISLSREGVPATVVGVPVRNMHTVFGIASLQDIEELVLLLEDFLKKPPKIRPQ
ncbi:MAG: M28 family peptidase [Candidatus Diapherotrites archaeon]|nr:M28 family peptidase [Candidatus Diapherotrites archaeon]